jgi:predicted metal-dependent HD superfamily phosphohydrolase
MPTLRERWASTWQRLSPALPPPALLADLEARYREPQRHYHTLQHLEECFAALDAVRPHVADVAAVELALWFHDAVYDVHRHDNEARSAGLAAATLRAAGLPDALTGKVTALILATRDHAAADADADAAALLDADLAILGAAPARFDDYERQIRAEYAHVPDDVFVPARRRILENFLQRPHLFATPGFRVRFGQQARANLETALRRLARP